MNSAKIRKKISVFTQRREKQPGRHPGRAEKGRLEQGKGGAHPWHKAAGNPPKLKEYEIVENETLMDV